MYCESDRVVAGRLAAQGDCASNGRKAAIRERSLAKKEVKQWPGCLSEASSRPSPTSQDKSQRASPVSHELAASQYKQGFSRVPVTLYFLNSFSYGAILAKIGPYFAILTENTSF